MGTMGRLFTAQRDRQFCQYLILAAIFQRDKLQQRQVEPECQNALGDKVDYQFGHDYLKPQISELLNHDLSIFIL